MKRIEKLLGAVRVEPLEEVELLREVVIELVEPPRPDVIKYRGRTIVFKFNGLKKDVGEFSFWVEFISGPIRLQDRSIGGVLVKLLDDGRMTVYLELDEVLDIIAGVAAVAWLVCGRRHCTISFDLVKSQVEVSREKYRGFEYTAVRGYPEHIVSYLLHYLDSALI